MAKKVKLLDSVQVQQKLNRLAYQVYEDSFEEKSLLVVGIDGNGYRFAMCLADKLKEISKMKIQLGKVIIDKEKPWGKEPKTDFSEKDYAGKTVILVDDVMNSGKTLIYAVKMFLDKPLKKLNTVVMVDRSHTRFPVKVDFAGLRLSTTLQEHIEADFSKKGSEAVYLM